MYHILVLHSCMYTCICKPVWKIGYRGPSMPILAATLNSGSCFRACLQAVWEFIITKMVAISHVAVSRKRQVIAKVELGKQLLKKSGTNILLQWFLGIFFFTLLAFMLSTERIFFLYFWQILNSMLLNSQKYKNSPAGISGEIPSYITLIQFQPYYGRTCCGSFCFDVKNCLLFWNKR